MKYSALSDIGVKRQKNEDNWAIVFDKDDNPIGFIIADGMGGYFAGEEASKIAVNGMLPVIHKYVEEKLSSKDIRQLVSEQINNINNKIMNYSMENLGGLESGTTLSLGMIIEDNLHIIHVGDSRIYRIREGEITRITEDHSLVSELMKEGLISEDEATSHPDRNKITKALGFENDFFPDIFIEQILKGDIYIFCTDGLYEGMDDQEILKTVLSEPQEEISQRLIEKAKQSGGTDNITVIVAWM